MSHKVKIRIAALLTALYLGSLSAAGLAVRSHHVPQTGTPVAAAVAVHAHEHEPEDD